MAEGVQSFLVFVSCFVAWMTSVNGESHDLCNVAVFCNSIQMIQY